MPEPPPTVRIRLARPDDDAPLRAIDRATWTAANSPAPLPPADAPFFGQGSRPADCLVAESAGTPVGYVTLSHPFPVPASAHVFLINGLAVSPTAQGRGVGRALVEAAEAEARRRGGRKLSLRVLGCNVSARRLYERCGFEVEGVLRGEFVLDGVEVDDVLMARLLT